MIDEFPQYLTTMFWLQSLLTWWVNEWVKISKEELESYFKALSQNFLKRLRETTETPVQNVSKPSKIWTGIEKYI